MLATETILLGLGLFWTREYLTRVSSSLLKEITPYARHHRIFFATNLLLAASQQGTAPLIRGIGGSFGDVAFFAAGHTLFLMSSAVLWQISQSLGPHFSKLKARQETAQIIVVAEAFLRLVAVASATLTLVALLVPHEIVGFVLGRSFAPAGATLAPLALAVTAATFCHLMRVLALAWDRIEVTFEAVAAQCVTLLILVPPLVRADGARGAAIAILGAQSVAALVWWRRMRTEAPGVLAGARRVLLIASPIFLVAAAGRSADLWLRVGLLVLCLAACGVALIRARVLDADEIRAWRAAGRLP
jgi:O-antigen/teichoic acid export membrane protein